MVLAYYISFIFISPIRAEEPILNTDTPTPNPTQEVTPEVTPEITPEVTQPEENPHDETVSPTIEPSISPTERESKPRVTTVAPTVTLSPTPITMQNKANILQTTESNQTPEITPSKQKDNSIELPSAVTKTLDSASNTLFSAIKKITQKKVHVHTFGDAVFNANHPLNFLVDKDQGQQLVLKAISSKGEEILLKYKEQYRETTDGNTSTITIVPPVTMTPGRYDLTITDETGATTKESFVWGVLALNTNKSIYTQGQTADTAIAVLDENGEIVCDADVKLTISDPDGKEITRSTEDESIKVNSVCGKKEFTLTPDYETSFDVDKVGTYDLILKSHTKNGDFTIQDSIQVESSVNFEVERTSATRLYPPVIYPMNIKITANRDFEGIVTDILPEIVTVLPAQDGKQDFIGLVKTPDPTETKDIQGDLLASNGNTLLKPYQGDHEISLGFGKQYGLEQLIAKITKSSHLQGHDGIDISMPKNTHVLATDTGKVILAGKGDFGNTVIVKHSWGKSYYGHLSSIEVNEGDEVSRGQEIALSGNSGISTGPHLHFGIKPNDTDIQNGFNGMVNPENLINFQTKNADVIAKNQELLTTRTIIWAVKLRKGETIELGYQYQVPEKSPSLYRIGKLSMIEKALSEDEQTKAESDAQKLIQTEHFQNLIKKAQADASNDINSDTHILGEQTSTENQLKTTERTTNASDEAKITSAPEVTKESDASDEATLKITPTPKPNQHEKIELKQKKQTEQAETTKIVFSEARFWQLAVDSVITTGGVTESEVQFGGMQRKVAKVNGNWYAFYNDGAKIYYRKSTDNGSSWGTDVDVDSSDSDNYNPSIAVSSNTIIVFWVDDGSEVIEGRTIDTASSDTQGTLCQTANQGTIGSTFMVSTAALSTTQAIVTYSDTSTDTEVSVFDITGLNGTCTATSVKTANLPFGSQGPGLVSSSRPVVTPLTSTTALMVFTDASNLRSALYDSSLQEWRRNNVVIASTSDNVYSVTSSSSDVWILSVSGTTSTKFYHYPVASTGINETSSAIDTDIGASGDEQIIDVDITCPSVTNCKIVYVDGQDETTPSLNFVDCDNADCSSLGSGTPREIDTDVGSSSEHDANPSIFCVTSDNCKVAYGDKMDSTTPDIAFIDCNDETCSTPSATTINADIGNTSAPRAYPEVYCNSDTDCQIVYLDNDLTSGSLVLADCGTANCSTVTNNTIQTNINNGQTGTYRLHNDIWCVAAADCRIVYQDGTNTDVRYIDCSTAACTGETPTTIDSTIGGTDVAVPVDIDCTGGSTDCKILYADDTGTDLNFVDCDNAACSSSTITTIDSTAGNIQIFTQISLDCSQGATDCKGTWTGVTTGGSEQLYFFDCDSGTCGSGTAVQIPGASNKGSVACASTSDCKLAYPKANGATPEIRFADCTNEKCTQDWESPTAPWSGQTNLTSVSLTYDSTNSQLVANVIKDSSEQAYYKTTPTASISWSSETSWAFTAGDLGHISSSRTAAGTGNVGVVLRQGSNFEFSKLPGFTISGICKKYDRSTNCANSETVRFAYNASLQADTTTTSSGVWSVEPASQPSSGDTITVYISGVADSLEANAVTEYDGTGSITNVTLYEEQLTLGSDDNATLITAQIDDYDNSVSANEDIFFDATNPSTFTVDATSQSTQEVLYILPSTTMTMSAGVGQATTLNTHDLYINSSSTLDMSGGTSGSTVNISGSYYNGGTFTKTSTCSATNALVNFTSTSTGETLSGTLDGTSDFCDVTFNGSGGGWTIQSPMRASEANATDTFNVSAGTVTLGNGGGDHLDVRGRFNVSSGATFQTMSALAQGDSTLCNSDDICIEINANSSPPSCSSCTIENSGTILINTNATVRFNSNASVESGLNNSSTGYLGVVGTQVDTGTDTGTDSHSLREGNICANESWTNDQHNNKYVRMMTGLARGRIYPISDTIASDPNCATDTDDSIAINDTSSTTDASPTVSCTGNKCVITLSGETIVSANNDHVGRYIHDKEGTEGYYLIVDSTETGADTITVIGDPSTLAIATNDDISVVDGVRSGDTFEIVDYAEVTAHTTNQGFIHTASGGEMVMSYAKVSELGAETSNKYGINGDSIWGSFASEGFLVEKSYISGCHRALRCASCRTLTSKYSNGAFDNYIVNTTQDAIDFSSGTDFEIAGNRIDTVTGNGRGIVVWNSTGSTIRDNIIINTGATYGAISSEASGTDGHNVVLYNLVYDSGEDGMEDIAGSQRTIYAGNHVVSSASDGIELSGGGVGFQFAGNVIDVSGSDDVSVNTTATSNLIGYQESYGYYVGPTFSDLYFVGTGTYTANYFGSTFGSSLEVDSVNAGEYLASFNHDSSNGVTYYNDYTIPDDNATTPQNENTVKMNYADNSWEDSFGPHFYDTTNSTGSEDTNLSFAFNGGTLGGSENFYIYKVVCNSASCGTLDTNAWDVYRTGVSGQTSLSKFADVGDATTGSTFTDATTNVQFNIGDAGTDYARADNYIFMVFQDAGNTNTQKTIKAMDSGAVLTIGSGESLQMIGSSSSPTLNVKDSGSSTGYTVTLSGGTINANYYSFTGQSSTGLNLSLGTVTNLSDGTFDDSAGGGASDTYITVTSGLLDSSGAQSWIDMIFDDSTTDSAIDKNVTLSGSPSACTNAWTFYSTGNKGGATAGEANDTDPGDGGLCNSGNGYLLWQDNGPTNDQLMRHGEWFHGTGIRMPFTF